MPALFFYVGFPVAVVISALKGNPSNLQTHPATLKALKFSGSNSYE
jgi:hypothetical protein